MNQNKSLMTFVFTSRDLITLLLRIKLQILVIRFPLWIQAILDLFGIDFHSDFEKVHVRSLEITWGHLGNGRTVSSSKVQILAIYRVNVKRFNVKIANVKIANLTSNDMKWPQMTSHDRFRNQNENPFQISPKSLIFIL